jgi:hypothetical protein
MADGGNAEVFEVVGSKMARMFSVTPFTRNAA